MDWGTSALQRRDFEGAKAQYTKIVIDAAGVPASVLYTTASLATPAARREHVHPRLTRAAAARINSGEIAEPRPDAPSARSSRSPQGLDFYGLLLLADPHLRVPAGRARGFAQEAIRPSASSSISRRRQEAEEATRRDLETARAMAKAEADAASCSKFSRPQADAGRGRGGASRSRRSASTTRDASATPTSR